MNNNELAHINCTCCTHDIAEYDLQEMSQAFDKSEEANKHFCAK